MYHNSVPMYRSDDTRFLGPGFAGISPITSGLIGAGLGYLGGQFLTPNPGFSPYGPGAGGVGPVPGGYGPGVGGYAPGYPGYPFGGYNYPGNPGIGYPGYGPGPF
ncbi:hypothetical protein [Oceanobacillus halotolerans]|uniref:hypothetical protein n=1 Tax=Oceanobacillus halotolerans TaxID=2663380 RepID=UPI0013DA21B0|nr:hypothetical protein [Oceanobacillus halotolerans]